MAMPPWAVALVCLGGAAGLLSVVALVVCVCRRRRGAQARSLAGSADARSENGCEADEERPAAPRRKVAVVGGGMSGLVCSRRLLAEG
eukprot:CAMPEP_0198508196 /NCGR_PEP_ID=MMETSP1462-20131121/12805_1 /TAXON_ID=1333877 /ORGANISM="Brandtodinium nutriculum, Strain RCC3387" /LENGTH=87 /DNA_ID=CAMNT_0044237465 /DNA_START=36 /DNA_END=296 /DNA_ORIENTATION=+